MITVLRNNDGSTYLRPTVTLRVLISQRLQSQPIHARTAQSLQELADCVIGDAHCRYLLPATVRWHQLAIANLRTNDAIRLPLLVRLVQLQLESGAVADAQRSARQAREIDGEQPVLALMQANVEWLAGNAEEAQRLLRFVAERRSAISDEQWRDAEKLIDTIDTKRRKR
jgi:predicted Zn-dependent protease